MLIAEFAKVAGLPRDTVRYYEKLGLLKPSVPRDGSSGYRQYTAQDIERATLIKLGQALGFTLREIKELAHSMESKTLTDAKKVAVMADRIRQIEVRVVQLNAIKRYFRAKVKWIEAGCVGASPSFGGNVVAAKASRHERSVQK
jgi:MerR family transcriptional regulator, copper efflux regulator